MLAEEEEEHTHIQTILMLMVLLVLVVVDHEDLEYHMISQEKQEQVVEVDLVMLAETMVVPVSSSLLTRLHKYLKNHNGT